MFTSRFDFNQNLYPSPRTNRWLYAVFALVACIMLFLIYTSTKDVITSIQVQSWPSTRATILESDVVESWRTRRRDFSNERITQYEPTVTYSYSVAGENYRGHQISFDSSPL